MFFISVRPYYPVPSVLFRVIEHIVCYFQISIIYVIILGNQCDSANTDSYPGRDGRIMGHVEVFHRLPNLLEKLKGRLDEKDALIGDLEKRLEVLQSDRWEKLDSDGMVTDIIAKHLKAALFEPEKSEGIESDGRDVHEREQREVA